MEGGSSEMIGSEMVDTMTAVCVGMLNRRPAPLHCSNKSELPRQGYECGDCVWDACAVDDAWQSMKEMQRCRLLKQMVSIPTCWFQTAGTRFSASSISWMDSSQVRTERYSSCNPGTD